MNSAAPPSGPLLRLSNINTFYGQAQVHFDLSIDVQRGHIVCLLGGNASGKSTTMKIILRRRLDARSDHAADRSARHRVRAGGAPAVRGHEREGKHPDGRLRAQ